MDVAAVERTLGALGTAFRLSRLYPPTHPAVVEAVRQVQATLPGLAGQGSVEWRVGSTGLMLGNMVLLQRNTQLAELASLLYSRGVRVINVNPAVTSESLLAICRVATGGIALDDPVLGQVAFGLGRRGTMRMQAVKANTGSGRAIPAAAEAPAAAAAVAAQAPAPAAAAVASAAAAAASAAAAQALPADVVAARIVSTLREARDPAVQLDAVRQLAMVGPQIVALRDVRAVADVICTLDQIVGGDPAPDGALMDAIGKAAEVFADRGVLSRVVARLGEPLVPPPERGALVRAVGAMGAVTGGLVLDAFLNAPTSLREPYRAAMRHAADRAVEPLAQKLSAGGSPTAVKAATELLGLTGSPAAVKAIQPLLKNPAEDVRAAALRALAEIGGRDAIRLAIPMLKDEHAEVRAGAARAVGAGGDRAAGTVLVGRLGIEADQSVVIALLRALGTLADRGSVELVAQFAEPGGMFQRRPGEIRVAAVEALGAIGSPEAKTALEHLRDDKDAAIRAAVEEALA